MARLLLPLLALLPAGCGSPQPGADLYAPVIHGPRAGPDLSGIPPKPAEAPPVDPREPLAVLKTRILTGRADVFAGVADLIEPPVHTVPPATIAKLQALIDEGRIEARDACEIGCAAGRLASWTNTTQTAYVQDYTMVPGASGATAHPVIGVLETGCSLHVEARAIGGRVQLERMDARVDRLLAMRRVRAVLESSGGAFDVRWDEPVILKGSIAEWPGKMALRDGDHLVIRLAFRAEQGCATARAYARGAAVDEECEPRLPAGTRDEAPLRRECLIVLEAKVQVPAGSGPRA